MQPSRFMVLTGHLNDYPLPDLVGILRHQQKTGRLMVEYAKAPAMFFFKDGELIDVQMEKLVGLQALCVALAEAPASFNFNPLIQPMRRSIQPSFQKAVSELLGSWDESALEAEKIVEPKELASQERRALPSGDYDEEVLTQARKALSFSSAAELPIRRYNPTIVTMAASGLLMLGLSAFIGATGDFGSSASSAASSPIHAVGSDAKAKLESAMGWVTAMHTRRSDLKARETGRSNDKRELAGSETKKGAEDVSDNPAGAKVAQGNLTKNNQTASDAKSDSSSKARSVKVVLQIDNGLVSGASIGNHKPGMDAYEALALRIARQRRYPSKSGQETVTIKVLPPE